MICLQDQRAGFHGFQKPPGLLRHEPLVVGLSAGYGLVFSVQLRKKQKQNCMLISFRLFAVQEIDPEFMAASQL